MPEPRIRLAVVSDRELEQALVDLGQQLAYPVPPDLASRVRARLEAEPPPRLAVLPLLPIGRTEWPKRRPRMSSRGTRDLVAPLRRGAGDAGVAPTAARHRVTPETPDQSGASVKERDFSLTRSMTRLQRIALVAACLVIAIGAGLALVPEARTAIADRLGLRGVEIRWIDEAPTQEPAPLGAPLLLGRAVTLEAAQAAVGFPILVPSAAGLDAPGEMYLSGEGAGAMISFVYPAGPGLPASDETGVGALLTQFQGETERGLIEKGLQAPDDGGEPETRLEPITVRGEPGFWITGAPHAVFFVCFDVGECREERYRLAGDVLLWEHHGMTLRLESALPRDKALAVAASVRAAE